MSSPYCSAILSTGTGGFVTRHFLSKVSTVCSIEGITTPFSLAQTLQFFAANWTPWRSTFRTALFPEQSICFPVHPSEPKRQCFLVQEGAGRMVQSRGGQP